MTAAELFAKEHADVRAMNLRFTTDWWTREGGNLADWVEYIGTRFTGKPDVRYLEIGSYEGRSAIWIAKNILTGPNTKLVCVDVFSGAYESAFDGNIGAAQVGDRIYKVKGYSRDVLASVAQFAPFDIVYVDGGHGAADVLLDALISWPMLRVGGSLVFDDYLLKVPGDVGPQVAIDAFLAIYGSKLHLIKKEWQVFAEKTAA